MPRSYGPDLGQDRAMPEPPSPRAVVCVPTYNELENLEPLVRALAEVLDPARDRVLVIDDDSPDGTGGLADRLAAELPWVSVLHRDREDGNRRRVPRGVPRGSRDGSRASCSRWTAISRTTRLTCRG